MLGGALGGPCLILPLLFCRDVRDEVLEHGECSPLLAMLLDLGGPN